MPEDSGEGFKNEWVYDPPSSKVLEQTKYISKPTLKRYDELKGKYSKVKKFPDNVQRVVLNDEDARELFDIASELWDEVYDFDSLNSKLTQLEKGIE